MFYTVEARCYAVLKKANADSVGSRISWLSLLHCGPQLGRKLQVGGKSPVPCSLLHRREESFRKSCTTTLSLNLQSTTLPVPATVTFIRAKCTVLKQCHYGSLGSHVVFSPKWLLSCTLLAYSSISLYKAWSGTVLRVILLMMGGFFLNCRVIYVFSNTLVTNVQLINVDKPAPRMQCKTSPLP